MVDILARDFESREGQGEVKMKDHLPEIHTVVLYKEPKISEDDNILVIDPSSNRFSGHLPKFIEQLALKSIVAEAKISGRLQIYKSGNSVGPNIDQYRDCIDIAVKIAFRLNEGIQHLLINKNNIQDQEAIIAVSNQSNIDSKSLVLDLEIPVRIKQSSNTEIDRKFQRADKSINTFVQSMRGIDEQKATHLKEETKKIFSNPEISDYQIIFDMCTLCTHMVKDFTPLWEADMREILGDTPSDYSCDIL